MTGRLGLLLALTPLLVAVVAVPARANGPEVGFTVGGVVPLASAQIRLVNEFVTVPVEGGRVRCQYDLRNLTDAPVTIAMAFVTNNPWPWDVGGHAAHYRGAGFAVAARQPIPWRLEGVAKAQWEPFLRGAPDSLPVWEVTFAPRERISLSITYQTTPDGGCDGSHCGSSMTYYAKAASAWAGRLEYASIRFEFGGLARLYRAAAGGAPAPYRETIAPSGYVEHPWGIVWEYRDWEPDADFTVRFDWHEPD